MRIPVEEIFAQAESFGGDVYVADYTRQTNSVRKLEFSEEAPTDIAYFHLENRKHVPVYGVNFEKHPAFVAGHPMCECLFTPQSANNKPWVMLLEMKYCEYANVARNSEDAFLQLKHSYAYLREEKGLLDPTRQNIYLVISIPEHSEQEPFDGFRGVQDEALEEYRRLRITVFARNAVLVATPNYLFEKKTAVRC